MAIFTCIYTWNDSTHISQVEALAINEVLKIWLDRLPLSDVSTWHGDFRQAEKHKDTLGKDIFEYDEEPTAIEKTSSVWLASFIVNDKLADLHIIKTDIA
jgi:hypothetical protein